MNRKPDGTEHEGRRSRGAAGSTTTCRGKAEEKVRGKKKHRKNKKKAQTKKNKKAPTKKKASSKKKQKGKQKNTEEDDRKEQFAQAYNNIPPKSTKKQRIEIRLRACVKYDLYPPELKKCIEDCDTGEWSPAKIHASLKKNAVNFGIGLKMVLKGLTNLNKR